MKDSLNLSGRTEKSFEIFNIDQERATEIAMKVRSLFSNEEIDSVDEVVKQAIEFVSLPNEQAFLFYEIGRAHERMAHDPIAQLLAAMSAQVEEEA